MNQKDKTEDVLISFVIVCVKLDLIDVDVLWDILIHWGHSWTQK